MKQLVLLSAEEKHRFFARLEALLAHKSSHERSPYIARSRHHDTSDAMTATATTTLTHVDDRNDAIVGDKTSDGPRQQRRDVIVIESDEDEEDDTMARALPNITREKRGLPPSAASTRKRVKQTVTLPDDKQLLHGQRVVLVPIGSDVSRKRLEIWREMVIALGGMIVGGGEATKESAYQQQQHQLLHLQHHQATLDGKTDSTTGETKTTPSRALNRRRSDVIEWSHVTLVIVSPQIDLERLQSYYAIEALPPRIKAYSPEWLVFLKREQRFPDDEAQFVWHQHHERKEDVHIDQVDTPHYVEAGGSDDSDDAYESGNDDGSDRRKESSREIVRAPPVQVDTEKFKLQEDELRKKKESLVNERIPIFHKLNPNFKTMTEASEGKKLKTEAFICQKSSLMQANLNAHLTDPLEELMEFLHVERDIWREYSYKKVVSSLKAMRTRVSKVHDLKGLWWAKGRMRDKVVEILETGKLEKLEAKKCNPRLRTLVEMSRVWGIGPATAAKLYNSGYKTMDSLRANAEKVLNFQQQIGLRHYKDFLTKIPRCEVTEIEKTVVDEIHRLLPGATALACGSYRRGKPSSGDCDILVTDPDSEECDILPELLRRLHATGFLTDDLTKISDEHHMGRCDTYMGVCRLRPDLPYRRLDIKVYPRRCFGFALLYFTGSDHFNRSMRLYARKKGWSLSDRALKRVVRIRKGEKIETGDSIVCHSEVDVFIALGLEYKDPTERNCFDIRFLDEDEANAKRSSKRGTEGDVEANDPFTNTATNDNET